LDINQYLPFLRRAISPKRLEHSLGVMQVMAELSSIYSLDPDRATTAALLHDAGKELTPAQQAEIVAEAKIKLQQPYDLDYVHYFHGPVGSLYVHREMCISDSVILDAITTHTYYGTGANFDTPLSWCLRCADLLEPGRDWSRVKWLNGIARMRMAAYGGHLAEAAFLETGWLIQWFEADGVPVHPNMLRVFQELSAKLNLDRSDL
jgi:predicted HD superfamily hydrolase involved in NAD metabolism